MASLDAAVHRALHGVEVMPGPHGIPLPIPTLPIDFALLTTDDCTMYRGPGQFLFTVPNSAGTLCVLICCGC